MKIHRFGTEPIALSNALKRSFCRSCRVVSGTQQPMTTTSGSTSAARPSGSSVRRLRSERVGGAVSEADGGLKHVRDLDQASPSKWAEVPVDWHSVVKRAKERCEKDCPICIGALGRRGKMGKGTCWMDGITP